MRTSRKFIKVEEENNKTLTGIIGLGKEIEMLQQKLESKDCRVIKSATFSEVFSDCQYLFILGDFKNLWKILEFCQKKGIKALAVLPRVREKEKYYIENKFIAEKKRGLKGRILRIGDVEAWDAEKLAITIMWAMFSRGMVSEIIDLSKENLLLPKAKNIKQKNMYKLRFPRIIKYLGALLVILSPLILIFINILLMTFSLSNFYNNIKENNWESANISFQSFKDNVAFNTAIVNFGETILGPLGNGVLSNLKYGNKMSNETVDLGEILFSSREIFLAEKQNILSANGVNSKDIGKLTKLIDRASSDLNEMHKAANAINLPFFPKEKVIEKISRGEEAIGVVKDIFPVLEKVISDPTSKKYLILFMNNMELRPTGGFIGSYGLLNIKNGSLVSFSIHDVYEADGQLKAHVDPPLPFRDHMGQPNWFLRDSNYDPDFSSSSQEAEWFLEKEMGDKVDGVVGMNINVLRDLLDVLGPVYLPDYKDTITSDNLFIKSVVYAQKGFFPGSTAKSDFLGSLANNILFAIIDGNDLNWPKIGEVLKSSLDQKNILLYFHDSDLQKLVEEKGWGGRMVDVVCSTPNCYADYLALSEANLGVNKANLYVVKQMNINKSISDDGSVNSEVSIFYENNSPPDAFPAGVYKYYLRLFIPKDSLVTDVLVDGEHQTDVMTENYGRDKEAVGIWVEILPLSKKKIDIQYTLPNRIFLTDKIYQFFFQKQPGDKQTNLNLKFNFSKNFKLLPRNFSPNIGGEGLGYTTDNLVDRVFVFYVNKNN